MLKEDVEMDEWLCVLTNNDDDSIVIVCTKLGKYHERCIWLPRLL